MTHLSRFITAFLAFSLSLCLAVGSAMAMENLDEITQENQEQTAAEETVPNTSDPLGEHETPTSEEHSQECGLPLDECICSTASTETHATETSVIEPTAIEPPTINPTASNIIFGSDTALAPFNTAIDFLILNASGSTITGWNLVTGISPTDIVIPREIDGTTITAIGANAFAGAGLTSLRFEEGSEVVSIGASAFMNNPFSIVEFPDSLKTISDSAFRDCAQLTSILIPNVVTSISEAAFRGCIQLSSVELSETLTNIGRNAFSGCTSLASITIPASVKTIASDAFSSSRIPLINLPNHAPGSISGVPWGASPAQYLGVEILWRNDSDSIFYFDSATGIIFGLKAGYSGDGNIVIPASIAVNDIQHPVTALFQYAFTSEHARTMIKTVTFEEGSQITEIPPFAFYFNQLTNITLPDSLRVIGNSAFNGSRLQSITLSDNLVSINQSAFSTTRLTSVTLPDSLTTISNYVFSSVSTLQSVTLPSNLTAIGDGVFQGTRLRTIEFPDTLKTIGENAFRNCSTLVSVSFPAGLTQIGNTAFENCTALASVVFQGSEINRIGSNAFRNTSLKNHIYLEEMYRNTVAGSPWGAVNAFVHWKDFTELPLEVIDDTGTWRFNPSTSTIVKYLGKEKEIKLPSSLTYDGETYGIHTVTGAFDSNNTITHVTISEGIVTIGNAAFRWCPSLASVVIPDSIMFIRQEAFRGCSSLVTVDLSNTGITTLGSSSFSSCIKLTSVKLPETLTTSGFNPFSNCSELVSINIPDALETINSGAFYACSKLESIDLSNTKITLIQNQAFQNCTSLTSVKLPDTLTIIDTTAFANTGLTGEIVLPGNLTRIEANAFSATPGITRFTVKQYRNTPSDSGAYDDSAELYKLSPASVQGRAPWGANHLNTSFHVYFMDDPRPKYTTEIIQHTGEGQNENRATVRIPDLHIPPNNSPISNVRQGQDEMENFSATGSDLDRLWNVSFEVTTSDKYSFTIFFLGRDYEIYIDVDVFSSGSLEEPEQTNPILPEIPDDTTIPNEPIIDDPLIDDPIIDDPSDNTIVDDPIIKNPSDETVADDPIVKNPSNETVADDAIIKNTPETTLTANPTIINPPNEHPSMERQPGNVEIDDISVLLPQAPVSDFQPSSQSLIDTSAPPTGVWDLPPHSLPTSLPFTGDNAGTVKPISFSRQPYGIPSDIKPKAVPILTRPSSEVRILQPIYAPTIGDEKTPLATFGGIPIFAPMGASYWALLNLILVIAGTTLAVFSAIRLTFRKREERKLTKTGFETSMDIPLGKRKSIKLKLNWLAFALGMALVGILVFLLTQDMRQMPVWTDFWTILHAIILAIEIIALRISIKKIQNNEPLKQT